MNHQKLTNTDVTIVHENGSDVVTDFVKIEEKLSEDNQQLAVWKHTPSGDPDIVLNHATVTTITSSE